MFTFSQWLITSVAVVIAAFLVPGVLIENVFAALIAALVIGIINTFLKPIIILFTLPINVVTLGLFTFVINALLIMLAGAIVPGFIVTGFFAALIFSLILTLVNWILVTMFENEHKKPLK